MQWLKCLSPGKPLKNFALLSIQLSQQSKNYLVGVQNMYFQNDFVRILLRSTLGIKGSLEEVVRRSSKPDIVQFGCNKTPYIFRSKYLVHIGTLLVNEIKKDHGKT